MLPALLLGAPAAHSGWKRIAVRRQRQQPCTAAPSSSLGGLSGCGKRAAQLLQPPCLLPSSRGGLTDLLPRRGARPRQRQVCAQSAAEGAALPEQQQDGGRYWSVVLPTALALLLCNMDRICLSVAMLPIAREMGWPEGVQGVVQSAFLWGYLATQLLGGTLADKYGGKLVMGVGVAWFSLASLLLPIAISPAVAAAGLTFSAVLASRFLVGFGEGVAMPAMNNLVARNIPPALKATALGNCYTGFHTGNLLGLVLSPIILQRFGWRALFYAFGLLGAPLLLFWTLVVPGRQPAVAAPQGGSGGGSGVATLGSSSSSSSSSNSSSGQQAQQAQQPISLLTLMSKPATWAIICVNFINHFGYFIYLNWMPTYFYKVLGVDLRASALLSFIPWLVMAVGSSAAGLLADGLVRSGRSVTSVRKGVQTAAFLGPVAALLVLANPGITAGQAVAAMSAALGITSLGQAGFVANMSDIAPRHAGRLFGLCNTFGSLAGILGVSAAGFIVEKTGSFASVFHITAALYVVGTVVWNLFCTAEKQFD